MVCTKSAQQDTKFKVEVTYVSDGRGAMWQLPFPFLHPSDIGVRLIDTLGIYHEKHTPDEFVVYWDFIVCVVPVGWRIKIWLIPPLERVLAGLAVLPKTKQILDRHKVKAIAPWQYASESADGSYDELAQDVEGLENDVPFPELQNDRIVLAGGNPQVVTAEKDAQKDAACHGHCDCGAAPVYQGIGCPCVSKCDDARRIRRQDFNPLWIPGG